MDLLTTWIARSGYLPHGVCFAWTPGLLWSMVAADAVIAAAYYSIPIALVTFVRRRGDVSFKWLPWMFSAFIFACGTTHLLAIWTIWVPDYGIEALVKMLTAAVSIVTAVAIWPLLPKALKIPSVGQLQSVIAKLEAEVAQRRTAEENLADTQESLAITLASIGAGFISTDREGRVTRMNPVAEAITGWSLADARGLSWWDVVRYVAESDAQRSRNPVDVVVDVDRPADSAMRHVVVSRSGGHTPVESSAALIRGADGEVRGMAVVFRDISQQQRNEALRLRSSELEAQNRQIQEANRLKSEFMANMSHELRTPLNAIIGFADLLHSGLVPVAAPKHREFLGHILSSGQHLLKLINDVLDLAKVESGKFEFFAEPVELPLLIGEVTNMLRHSAAGKQIHLSTDIADGLGTIVLDPSRFKQVLYNYLSNAIKFTPHGGYIGVRALPNGSEAFRVEVEDTGIGIAAADIDRLFVDFQQLDGGYSKEHAGTGLGLALTKRLVQAQGGSVGVYSEVGVRTVFHAILPRVAVGSHGTPTRSPASEDPGRCLSDARVLVIDDDFRSLELTLAMLDHLGVQSIGVSGGREALDRLDEIEPDAIVLDLVMPGMDGFAVIDALRLLPRWSDTPVFVWTSLDLGADDRTRLSGLVTAVVAKGSGGVSALLAELAAMAPRLVRH